MENLRIQLLEEANSITNFIDKFNLRNFGKDQSIINHLFKIEFNCFLEDSNFSKGTLDLYKIN